MMAMETLALAGLHGALRDEIEAPGSVTKSRLVALLKAHPQSEAPAEENLVIRSGILCAETGKCTCDASGPTAPPGGAPHFFCGLDYVMDLSPALKKAGYRRG